MILCYELSDQEALTLHQTKAHDVRAFAASKAFQLGVSLEQILSACHWKSHNTFTQFYLKDVAWADVAVFFISGQWWLPNRSTTKPQNEEICKYVHNMYIIPKNKTNCDLLPLGSLFLMGLNSTLSSYSQSRSEKKGGGGQHW